MADKPSYLVPEGYRELPSGAALCRCLRLWKTDDGVYWCCGGDPKASGQERWDRHFLDLALAHARMSKDPSTKVGAVIVGPDREIVSAGFNGFPRGVADTPERLNDRQTKLSLVVHGEINAIMAAARIGTAVKGCTMYVAATDVSGEIWGGPPCLRCTVETIQAGITEIVSWPMKTAPSRWHASLEEALKILSEAGIAYREISPIREAA